MKLNDKQRNIIVQLIDNEILKYKNHGLKIDQEYKVELETLKDKMVEKTASFDTIMKRSMEEHSSREDW